jgi:xylulokinase
LIQIGGPSQNGADTLVWLAGVLGEQDQPLALVLEHLLSEPRDPHPLLFLPYLQGERVPHWDPHLRGAFVGLQRRHGPTDCAFAVLEGIAFLNRLVLERAEAAAGKRVTEIRFGGGGAANATWSQIKADICDRTVAVAECDEPGILGGAIVAFKALGRFPDFAAGQEKLVRIRQRFAPRAAQASRYARLYDLFRETETALAPLSRKLAKFDCHL